MTYRSKAQHRREDEIQHHGIMEKNDDEKNDKGDRKWRVRGRAESGAETKVMVTMKMVR